MQGCHQVGKAISVPPLAVLAGLLLVVGFSMSHSTVELESTEWIEPVILWIGICMPTGCGKSTLCKFLKSLVKKAREECGLTDDDATWWLDDQSFEKMGVLMADNCNKVLGLYDELPMFLAQINVFRGRGLSDSRELAVFLQMYGSNEWSRKTGMQQYHQFTSDFILQ